ncbi:MAG: MBL fold metallo-hydrolase, partial [Acidobacteriota bacterium]
MLRLRLPTSWGELLVAGGSRAGEASLLLLPQLRLALDAGRPARALVPLSTVAISHGHLDHLLGVPAWASQRQLQGIPGGRLLVPAGLVARIEDLLATCARLEGGKPYGVTASALSPGDRVTLRNDLALRFFATSHWVETLGCCVEWTRKRLRPELAGAPPEELRRLREAGVEVTRQVRTDLLAYLADTGPEVFEREPWLADAEVLIVECTFLRPADRDRARQFGHLHLEDLITLAPRLCNRHLVLTHLSRRHRLAAGERAIRDALADRLVP